MIRFKDVTRYLGGRPVLDGMNLDVEKGETYVIVGASGTGKSVTLKHMVRLLTPDSGEVWVGDECVSRARGNDLAKIRMRFGYLFQSAALLQWCSVGTNVGLPLMEHTGMSRDEIDTVVREKLALVGLEEA
ncbi:MAG TPA: ATP-binding cassette domain-containing protein, partial [Kiritimatiellia bacterium]|nr:ATP-binding cassette domain-containing protein [Kiritimatiellia bacterium]